MAMCDDVVCCVGCWRNRPLLGRTISREHLSIKGEKQVLLLFHHHDLYLCPLFPLERSIKSTFAMSAVIDVDAMEEDEDDLIDDEQLDEYREMVDNLGTFPVSKQDRARP